MMTVPEASVDLNYCIPSRKDEVGTTRQFPDMELVAKS